MSIIIIFAVLISISLIFAEVSFGSGAGVSFKVSNQTTNSEDPNANTNTQPVNNQTTNLSSPSNTTSPAQTNPVQNTITGNPSTTTTQQTQASSGTNGSDVIKITPPKNSSNITNASSNKTANQVKNSTDNQAGITGAAVGTENTFNLETIVFMIIVLFAFAIGLWMFNSWRKSNIVRNI